VVGRTGTNTPTKPTANNSQPKIKNSGRIIACILIRGLASGLLSLTLLCRVVRVLCPVPIWKTVVYLVHGDAFWYRANQVTEVAAHAFFINDGVNALAVFIFGCANRLV
jgi:hypothetical protein